VRHELGANNEPAFTRLAVTEGAVRVRPADSATGEAALIDAGRQIRFTREQLGALTPLDEYSQAWLDGTFVAEGMRLQDFLAELGRYRPGYLGCAPEVAVSRITGAWPLKGAGATDRIRCS